MINPKSWGSTIRMFSACAVAFLLTSASVGVADTQVENGSYDDIAASEIYSSPGSPTTGFSFFSEPVTGISKFDPSLGTLNSVTLFAEFSSDVEINVFADSVLDEEFDHFVDFDADFVQAFIGYSPGGSSSTFTPVDTTYSAAASCGGGPFDGPCGDGFIDANVADDSSVLSDLGSYNMSDFVGAGPVTALEAIIAMPGDGLFALENVDSAAAEIFANMSHISLTVEYDFTPIPEPASFALALLGLLSVGMIRKNR